jgi:hypothetical protein
MDDYSITSLTESKNEWCARLVSILTNHINEGINSIFDEATKLCVDNDEENKYLMTFQNLLSTIPNWNDTIIEVERKRIETASGCKYLEDLITCVHIIQLKALTCIRVGQKQKKINIDIPSLDKFIHQIYINMARKLYTNIYLFEKDIYPLQVQKNNRELEVLIKEAILNTIRENIPVEQILRSYMEETEEQEVVTEPIVAKIEDQEKKAVTEDISLNTVPFEDKLGELAKKIENKKNDNEKDDNTKPNLVTGLPEIEKSVSTNLPNSPNKLSIDFSNLDSVIDTTGDEKQIEAPKDVETLNKIAEINNAKRKEEEDDDDKLTIGNDISLDIDTISLDNDAILGDVISL